MSILHVRVKTIMIAPPYPHPSFSKPHQRLPRMLKPGAVVDRPFEEGKKWGTYKEQ